MFSKSSFVSGMAAVALALAPAVASAEPEFGPGKVSTFEIPGIGTATVGGVANLTWSMFTGTDYFGTKCFVDSRIVDAEKTAEKNNDNFWCGALSLMDLAFIQGWAPSDYATVDSMVAEFSKTGENDIRYVSGISFSSFDPRYEYYWSNYFYEGSYGYSADENFIVDEWDHYVGMFRWLKDKKSVSRIMEAVSTGIIGSDFGTVLKNALPTKLLQIDVGFDSSNTHPYWGGCGTGHSVVCCGCVCDGLNNLKALFIIDSDNSQYTNGGGTSAPNSIIYCPVTWSSVCEEWTITGIWGQSGTLEPGYLALATRESVPNKVLTPVLDPASNIVFTTESLTVKCTCAETGAEIHFTTNGDAVAKSSEKWPDAGLVLTDTTTVKVRAYKDGLADSDEVTVTYTSADPEGTGKRALDPVVAVGKKDRTEAAAAATYTGWLRDASGNLTGSFTMKVGKVGKGGVAKVTMTVTDLSGQKTKYKGDYDVSDGKIAGGDLEDLAIGKDGVVGTIKSGKAKTTLTGARNAPKEEDQAKVFDAAFKGKVFAFAFTGKAKSISGSAAFTVKFSAKGKAKVSGTLMDGSKVSTSAQLIVGDGKDCALPIAFSKKNKASFGLVLWFGEKAAFKEATSIKTCQMSDGSTPVSVTFEKCVAVDGNMPKVKQLLVSEKKVAKLEVSGKKIVATGEEAAAKPKLSYAVKTGLFTGSYKATVKGATKSVTAKITGAWLGGRGVGTASAKVNKVTTTWPVEVK